MHTSVRLGGRIMTTMWGIQLPQWPNVGTNGYMRSPTHIVKVMVTQDRIGHNAQDRPRQKKIHHIVILCIKHYRNPCACKRHTKIKAFYQWISILHYHIWLLYATISALLTEESSVFYLKTKIQCNILYQVDERAMQYRTWPTMLVFINMVASIYTLLKGTQAQTLTRKHPAFCDKSRHFYLNHLYHFNHLSPALCLYLLCLLTLVGSMLLRQMSGYICWQSMSAVGPGQSPLDIANYSSMVDLIWTKFMKNQMLFLMLRGII